MTASAIQILAFCLLHVAANAAVESQLNFYQVPNRYWKGDRTRDLPLTSDIRSQDSNTQMLQCVMQLSRRWRLERNECLVFQPDSASPCFIGTVNATNCEALQPLTVATGANSTRVWVTKLTDRYNCSIIQHRISNSTSFYRNWTEYVNGFGEGEWGNFWIGLEKIYQITKQTPRVLRIEMRQWDGSSYWASYSGFQIGPASSNYRLISVGSFTASSAHLGDSMSYHVGQSFSTFDADFDSSVDSCSQIYKGAWWYGACHHSNPNGLYFVPPNALNTPDYATGVVWNSPFGYYYSLMEFKMILP